MDRMPTELKGYVKHVKSRHEEHMEYDGMRKGMLNSDGKHCWYLMMQSMSKLKKEAKIVMPKTSTPQKLMIACARCTMFVDHLPQHHHWLGSSLQWVEVNEENRVLEKKNPQEEKEEKTGVVKSTKL